MTNNRLFGERLRQARKTRKMTQGQVARKLSVRRATVCGWESGIVPEHPHLHDLGGMFNVGVSWLLGARADPSPPEWLTPEERTWLWLYRGVRADRRQALIDALRESSALFERMEQPTKP